jgi:hypothetical protein
LFSDSLGWSSLSSVKRSWSNSIANLSAFTVRWSAL